MVLPFLILPREIRDEIYSYLLITDEGICPVLSNEPQPMLNLHPNILRTCKIVFEEASSVLIRSNHFIFDRGMYFPPKKTRRSRRDRSWDIMLNRYHCNPPHFPSGLGGSSHRIRHLDIRLADSMDSKTVISTLHYLLDEQNQLKTLNLEFCGPRRRRLLPAILRGIKNALACAKLTIMAIQERDGIEQKDDVFMRLNGAISKWNKGRERKFVEIEPKSSDEEWYGKQVWTLVP